MFMNFTKTLLAAAALTACIGANATVVASLGTGVGPFLTPTGSSTACTGANCQISPITTGITGGRVLANGFPNADPVLNNVTFLSAGPTNNGSATVSLVSGISFISFLWGSPDDTPGFVNTVTVNSMFGGAMFSQSYTPSSLGFGPNVVGNQDPSANQYVSFSAVSGHSITGLVFASTKDAFEATNFSVTPIPEPETYALMLAGLAALGFVSKRRKQA